VLQLLIAFILFLPTTRFVGMELYVVFVPLFLYIHRKDLTGWLNDFRENKWKPKYLFSLWLYLLILLLIFINILIGGFTLSKLIHSPIPFAPVLAVTAFMAMDRKVLQYLLLFFAVDGLVGVAEYLFGVNTFFTASEGYYQFVGYESLYHTRVFGLGENSSNLALNAFLGLLLLNLVRLPWKQWQFASLFVFFVVVILISFGRTVLVASVLLMVVLLVRNSYLIWIKKAHRKEAVTALVLVVMTIAATVIFRQFLWVQFTRFDLAARLLAQTEGAEFVEMLGLGELEMAGRRVLWANGLDFLKGHLVLGNNSVRFLDGKSHLHNSWLQFTCTHGLLILFVQLSFIIANLNWKNLFLIGFIAMYSFGQFGIFWNLSTLDVLFFGFLIFYFKIERYESPQ